MSNHDLGWLVNSLIQAVSRLPHLTEIDIMTVDCTTRVPLGLFANLSKLSFWRCSHEDTAFLIPQMASAIANNPQLKGHHVT
jgi:hypothetical protein